MRTFCALALLPLAALAQMPQPERLKEHEWLQKLVGEWSGETSCIMEGSEEPVKIQFQESVRSIGGIWVVGEGTSSFGGSPFKSVLTLGYDPKRKAFVGTWIDTMQTHMWSYTGTLNDAGTTLTLTAEGPSCEDPSKMATYRDTIEFQSPDRRTLSSAVKGEDGTWTTIMTAEYRRKKK